MNKAPRGDEPTQPVNTATQLRYKLMAVQHKASTAKSLFYRFRRPIIIAATSLTIISGAVTAVSLTLSGDAVQLQQVDSDQVKQQLLDSAKNGDIRKLKDALQKGASIDSQDEFGETPFLMISRTGNIKPMKFLLDKGANPNAQDHAGWSALICVSREGNLEAAQLLLDSGADPKLFNETRETALFWAATRGNNELSKLLLEKGANVDAATAHGVTSLMQAAAYGHLELCLTLLSAGARVNMRDGNGRTAKDYASLGGLGKHRKAKRLLNAYGAKNGN
ncbi:MAG: ankyrin repeat domain-containing protein [bacterium]|nr:ankyrin repeat domain-containing protein [bacterium]